MCFWCPLKYSNWEILWCFVWSWSSSWGQLNTWKSWPLALEQGGQCRGRWEFSLLSLEFRPICHGITPTIWHILASEGAFFCIQFISWNVPQLRIIETVVLNCKSQFRCIYIGSAEFCWISLVWLDRTHKNDIKLSK